MADYRNAASILHCLAGSPEVQGCASVNAPCCVCGDLADRGMAYQAWQGANFTDQNKLRRPDAEHVCEPCIWSHAWNPPPGHPPPPPGKKGPNLRMFTHLWQAGDYKALTKREKPEILAWLRAPKRGLWFAAIADSGQKHLIARTPVNPDATGRLVRFEEQTVSLADWSLLDAMVELLTSGLWKSEIETGRYASARLAGRLGIVQGFERRWCTLRGSGWFGLCLWLAQKGIR